MPRGVVNGGMVRVGLCQEVLFESADLWDREQSARMEGARLERMVEFVPVVGTSLLDAGGGNGLFIEKLRIFRPNIRRAVCLDGSLPALVVASGRKVRSSLDLLPFEDGAFDIVTCLEVLEHLPVPVYRNALAELARVARAWLIVAVPFRQDLEEMLVACPGCRARFNPYYHVRRFDEDSLRGLFTEQGWECERLGFQGESNELVGARRLVRLMARNVSSESPFRFEIPCPVCGQKLPPAVGLVGIANTRRALSLRSLAKRVWPKIRRPSRAIAVYRRALAVSGPAACAPA